MGGALLLLLALLSPASAYETVGAAWPLDAFPLPWTVVLPEGGSLDPDEALAAIEAGVQVWEDAGCGVSFRFDGVVTDATFDRELDGRNTLFLLDDWPGDAALLTDQGIAIDGRTLVEADIALNAEHFTFVTSGADGSVTFDLQGTVAHEWGHVVGLWHADDDDASLSAGLNGREEARDLHDDDIEGLCALYAEPRGALGDACAENLDCALDLFCLDDEGASYCSATCAAESDCPDGYACLEAGGEQVCAVEQAGCGCAHGGSGGTFLGALVAGLLARRRRRRPHGGRA